MAKKKEKDDRKELLIRFRLDDLNRVSFIDPCCDEIPIVLFSKVMEAIGKVEMEWNENIEKKHFPKEYL